MLQPPTQLPPLPPIPPAPQVPEVVVASGGPPEFLVIAVVAIVGIIAAAVVLAPLVRALSRRLEGKSLDHAVIGELEQLRARVAEFDHLQNRMADLEERVDFSERLLTQSQQRQQLGAGDASASR